MRIERGSYSFTINPDWIAESGLKPFSKTSDHYLYMASLNQTESIIVVRHEDIDPKIRKEGVPIFKDGKVDGKQVPAKERVLNILTAIVNETPLPPVEIVEARHGEYKYNLHHGCHRLHLSILAGFNSIPAILNTWL